MLTLHLNERGGLSQCLTLRAHTLRSWAGTAMCGALPWRQTANESTAGYISSQNLWRVRSEVRRVRGVFFFLDGGLFGGVCKIGVAHTARTFTYATDTQHSPIHTGQLLLISTLPPLLFPSISVSLFPFLSFPLLGREMEQKVACNYILIFGWYLLCYRGC